MGRARRWDEDSIEEKIIPKLQAKWSVSKVAKFYDISRQRLYKILEESGYNHDGSRKKE